MNFYTTFNRGKTNHVYATILLKLKLTLILLITVILQASATSYAQITLNEKSSSLEKVIQKIRKQTGYDFFYSASILSAAKPITLKVNNVSVEEALRLCFENQPISYAIEQKTIILQPAERVIVNKDIVVTGRVVDEDNKPIVGASVKIKGSTNPAFATGKDGEFKINATSEGDLIVVSYIGFETQEVRASKLPITIRLKESKTIMKDVVITGTGINRKKDSFTGTTAVFTGEELKAQGNNNIIQSLKTLDPSFLQITNNTAGSNPNVMPIIEVRGKSSIPSTTLRDQFGADPNQPLFVLDGFPTTLQTIVDLDMNRVATVSILKDAASTALYGAQASNGVVVIETLKPKPGELRFSYTQDFRLEFPDVSGYNMMNATEKLQFEKLAGRYIAQDGNTTQAIYLEQLYNSHLANVQKGIDSYWLSDPLQIGYSTNSSINASGGDNAFAYNLGMNYRTGTGAMIGSGRDSYSGSINLSYRKKAININNITYIRGNSTTNSPYGTFDKFVNANPYFEKNETNRYLEETLTTAGGAFKIANPLYDASLPQYSNSKNVEFQNNLNSNFDISKSFRLTGALQLTKGNTTAKNYRSPEMSEFINTPTLRKGKYTDDRRANFSYQANLLLSYQKVIQQKHVINANWRNTISQNQNEAYTTVAEGFPEGNLGNPRFAYSFIENGSPSASNGIYRTLNTTITANYSYDNRYLADAVYRIDGSTAYGSNKQYSPYYAFGLGWNLHNEVFVKNKKWINSLRLTGNIGVTGNQNFGNISSVSVFNYNSNTNYNSFGQGVSLVTLGNPDLEPQKTRHISTSIEFSLFNNRFVGYLNAYNKKTDPLIVPVDLPSSTGVFGFPYNVGNLTYKGLETKLTFFPIYNLERKFTWSIGVTGAASKSKYGGIGNSLNTLNKQQENSRTLLRYVDGNSADAIWAIQSVGIDPATGREVFVTKSGQYTFDYSAGNIVNVGNTAPIAEGVITTNLRYKNFNFGIALRYKVGGDVFNTALYNKVENISLTSIANNQDRRALYDRWKNPGDVSQFKGISQTSTTQISSRFVQNENSLSSESLNIGYTWENTSWIKSLGLRTLNLNVFGNEFLYASTIRADRGTDYPYARTFAFSLKASF